jgi:hypothetical protein
MDGEEAQIRAPSDTERNQPSTAAEDNPARQLLLNEARTTVSQQLGQIDKIDDTAVRTVRITLLLVGVLAGGSNLEPFPDLGLFGALGTWSLLFSFICGLFVYGTSRVFIGSAPDRLAIGYKEPPIVENTYIEILGEYEDGITDNRQTLRANGFILTLARVSLAIAIILIIAGFIFETPVPPGAASSSDQANVQTFIGWNLLF